MSSYPLLGRHHHIPHNTRHVGNGLIAIVKMHAARPANKSTLTSTSIHRRPAANQQLTDLLFIHEGISESDTTKNDPF